MTINDCKSRIKEAVNKLNRMEHTLKFGLEETDYGIFLTAHSSGGTSRFGAYEVKNLFEDFKNKTTAYEHFMQSVELMVASTRLNDPKAYHNLIAN